MVRLHSVRLCKMFLSYIIKSIRIAQKLSNIVINFVSLERHAALNISVFEEIFIRR